MQKFTTIRTDTPMPRFKVHPFFLDELHLKPSENETYLELLNRARLSMTHSEYIDNTGNAFILYPVRSIAKKLGRSVSTVETALNTLENAGLISRRMTGEGRASHIYVNIPREANVTAANVPTGNSGVPIDTVTDVPTTEKTVPICQDTVPIIGTVTDRNLVLNRTAPQVHSNNKENNNNYSNKRLCTGVPEHRIWKRELREGIKREKDLDAILKSSLLEQIDEYRKKYPTRESRQIAFEDTLHYLRSLSGEVV